MIEIPLNDVPRATVFPYPVLAFGATAGQDLAPLAFYFADKVEICIRLSAAEDIAVDTIDGREYRTPFPHVFVKFPFRRFAYAATAARNAVHFSYSLATLKALLDNGLLVPDVPFIPVVLTAEISSLLSRLTAMQTRSHELYAADRIDTLCFALLQEIRFARPPEALEPDRERARVMAVASLLKCNFPQEIDLDTLIREQSMSRRSFYRHWREHFAETPHEYLLNLRLQDAARNLRDSALPVTAVATNAGFTDTAYFSKIFKKRFGVSPLAYRTRR